MSVMSLQVLASVTPECLIADVRKNFLDFTPHPKQLEFYASGTRANRRTIFAGNRTGKTYCLLREVGFHATGRYPSWWNGKRYLTPPNIFIASVNLDQTREVLQKPLLGGEGAEGIIHSSLILDVKTKARGLYDYVTVRHVGGVATIKVGTFGVGREGVQGYRFDIVALDEEPPFDFYQELFMRTASFGGQETGQILLTMTPLNGFTEMYGHFYNKSSASVAKDDVFWMNMTWDDNPYLSQEEKERLEKGTPTWMLEAKKLGIPIVGHGKIYPCPESEFLITPFPVPDHWPRVYGLDVGWNNPTAAAFLAIDRDNDVVYVVSEYSDSQLTAAQHASRLLSMGCSWMTGVCDPAARAASQLDGKNLFDEYLSNGLRLVQAKYAKTFAIEQIWERIRSGRFKVFDTLSKFMFEWRNYSYDDYGRIIKKNDHLMNALEFVMVDGLKWATTKQNSQHYQPIRPIRF